MFSIACNNDDLGVNKALSTSYINYNIDSVTTWHRDWCYIIGKPDFKVDCTLIIQEGAIIKFDPAVGRSITVTANGYIAAQGLTTRPIVFTSLYDDSYGGDSNKDGFKTKANINDWDGIKLGGKSQSVFFNCIFKYSGGGDTTSTIMVRKGSRVAVSNCTFAYNNGGTPDKLWGVLNCRYAQARTLIRENVFYNNSLPLTINPLISIDNTNSFVNPNNNAQTNTYNAIFVDTWTPIKDSIMWLENKVALVIMSDTLSIPLGNQLLLGNYLCLKFNANAGVYLPLKAHENQQYNFNGPGVLFTSYFDDTRYGDSNGDGNATYPNDYKWNGFTFGDSIPGDYPWNNVKYIK